MPERSNLWLNPDAREALHLGYPVCSTMFRVRPSRYWRSYPNRRLSHGKCGSEVQNKGSASFRGERRLVSLSSGSRDTGCRHHTSWQTRWRTNRVQIEDDWFDYRLEHDPRFIQRVEQAR